MMKNERIVYYYTEYYMLNTICLTHGMASRTKHLYSKNYTFYC